MTGAKYLTLGKGRRFSKSSPFFHRRIPIRTVLNFSYFNNYVVGIVIAFLLGEVIMN